MFSNIIFLILVLLLTSFALEINVQAWNNPPLTAFFEGLALYALLLGVINLQTTIRKIKKSTTEFIVNCEILIFLLIFYFAIGSHRFYSTLGADTLSYLVSLSLYFFAFGFYNYFAGNRRFETALQSILLILPFTFPFLLLTLILDIFNFVYIPSIPLLIAITLIFIGITLLFLPPLVVKVWRCQPLEDSPLKARLENLCQQAHFKHAGIKTWTVMNQSLTAAIIGILPRLRYIMFSKRLLRELPSEEIESILAHEIGHNYRKHLLLFPLILFGMLVILWILSNVFSEPFNAWIMRQSQTHPSSLWELAYHLSLYLCCAIVVALYIRYVFGLFSRLFERQADLHGFILHLDPQHMINALNTVAIATGNTHTQPNWHHYSIQERIDFLKKAQYNPQVIAQHHRRTRRYFIGYLILLFAGILLALNYHL